MTTQRGTLDITLASYRLPVTNLLRKLGEPSTYSAQRLRSFFLQQVSQAHPGTAKNTATALRMFLRFLVAHGDCVPGLEFAIPTVARWHLSSLPKYLPVSAVDSLIASCDQSTPLGARDRAMLLLVARLGLRASDVSGMKFQHLIWTKGALIVAGKNRRKTELPLPQEVGDAILHYLQHGRPAVANEYVFMTVIAPFIPITRQTVGKAVARTIRRTGIAAPSRGTHLLRHSLATTMLSEGISLPAIGALLRHASIETTSVYAKVDVGLTARGRYALARSRAMLSESVNTYLSIRRTLGFKLNTVQTYLTSYERFATIAGDTYVRSQTAIKWAEQAASEDSRARRMDVLIRFARFAHADDNHHEIPADNIFCHRRSRRRPYIFTDEEVHLLVQ